MSEKPNEALDPTPPTPYAWLRNQLKLAWGLFCLCTPMRALIIACGACLLFAAGCELMPPYQMVDYRKTPDGKVIIRDTPRSWGYHVDQAERAAKEELSNVAPGGGFKNWNEAWVSTIKGLRNGEHENPEKYVDYIVERRRALGLPEIVFPPSETSPVR